MPGKRFVTRRKAATATTGAIYFGGADTVDINARTLTAS
jgi:hypothetical protein